MRHEILLRWIAEAEARWVRSLALLTREASEPHACIVAVAVPPRLVRLCGLRLCGLRARLDGFIRSRARFTPGE